MQSKMLALAALAVALGVAVGCGSSTAEGPLLLTVTPNMGPEAGGTTLTLSGINLTEDLTVMVGGMDAGTIGTGPGPYSCVCDTPAGTPGTVDIVVATGNGTYVLPDAFTYNAAPSVALTLPAVDASILPGYPVQIAYTDDDPDDVATTALYADRDGNPATTADQILIEDGRAEQNGAGHMLTWSTANVPAGTYSIVVRCDDGMNAPVTDTAGGRITVGGVGWARHDGGTNYEYVRELATFEDGSVVVVGYFYVSATFGAGEANETTLTSSGNYDAFVARYAPDGTLAWAHRAGGSDYDYAWDVAAFPDGSCVVAGEFRYNATFGNGFNLSAYGNDDVFLARYAADGTVTWVHRMGSTEWDDYARIAGFADGSFVVTGRIYNASPYHLDATTTLTRVGSNEDLYIARFDATGVLQWARQGASSTGYTYVYDICAFPNGDCAAAGRLERDVTLSYGEPDALPLSAQGDGYDLLLMRYDAAGALLWGLTDGGPEGRVYAQELAAYPDGSIAVGGYFYEDSVLGYGQPGEAELLEIGGDCDFLARYTADGTYVWARVLADAEIEGLGVDAMGNCVVGGTQWSVALIGADGPDQVLLIPEGQDDIFLASFGPDGAVNGARNDGGGDDDRLYGMALFPDGSIAAAGYFYDGEIVLGRGGPNETVLVAPSTDSQIWVARFNPDGSL